MMTNTDNNNYNIERIEVQAPPTITIMHDDASADDIDIEQLPIANDDHNEHVVVNYHASKKYIVVAAFGTVVASAAFFGVGMGSGFGISELVFSYRNKSAASSSVSSASSMAFTTSNGVGAKAGKVAKSIKTSIKSSKSKSGKSVTTTTSTTPVTTTTTTTCQSRYVASRSNLGVAIPGGGNPAVPALVPLPVELNAGCSCTVANVAIDIGINHPNVQDLSIALFPPVGEDDLQSSDGDSVILFDGPPSDANLVPGNLITFDDSASGALNPLTLGDDVDGSGNILAGTYFAPLLSEGSFVSGGLGKFNGETAAGDWTLEGFDFAVGNTGTIESVELTITCAV